MLGFQYVVAKSRELSSALDRELSAVSSRAVPFRSVPSSASVETAASNGAGAATDAPAASPVLDRQEGHAFLAVHHQRHAQAVRNHQQLLKQGHALDAALSAARLKLETEAQSEQYVTQHFHLVSNVRQQLAQVRTLVLHVVEEADHVEGLLLERCEERAALQNAEVAATQQQELERFELSIAEESEGRRRELREKRREKLASAFASDLRRYQTLGDRLEDAGGTKGRMVVTEEDGGVTLDEVDLVVAAYAAQLDAFYDSGSERDEEEGVDAKPRTSLASEVRGKEGATSDETTAVVQEVAAAGTGDASMVRQ
ncbi:unnamed protein product [Hyaloperonospora brassicae]|uniref:Uncharacterized protein n=1 Tax=Hyaloperonospora brassicae TaxID=162125 RepID=A0AAV0T4Q8_HYABA|nr:unnamed protein product [Hyaloperonospora brassicae]